MLRVRRDESLEGSCSIATSHVDIDRNVPVMRSKCNLRDIRKRTHLGHSVEVAWSVQPVEMLWTKLETETRHVLRKFAAGGNHLLANFHVSEVVNAIVLEKERQ